VNFSNKTELFILTTSGIISVIHNNLDLLHVCYAWYILHKAENPC